VGELLDRPFSPAQLAELACRIEPSDSIMFTQATMLAYRDSGQAEMLGAIPALPCLILDPGEAVDTVTYNARLNLHLLRELAASTQTAINLLTDGLARNDSAAIGAATSLSATAYQVINYSGLVTQAQQWAAATGAVGIVRAHSGSLVGLLYSPETPLQRVAAWLATQFAGTLIQTQLVGAGYRILEAQPARIKEFMQLTKNGTQMNTDFTDYVKIW
jgi:L-threonine kinase